MAVKLTDKIKKAKDAEYILKIAREIEALRTFVRIEENEELWMLDPTIGLWSRNSKAFIEHEIEVRTSRKTNRSFASEALGHITRNALTRKIGDILKQTTGRYVLVGNGIIDLEDGQLLPFNSQLNFHNRIKFDYKEKISRKPLFIEKLEEICPDPDKRQWIIDYIATIFWSEPAFERMLWLVGIGGNGKDFLIDVLVDLTGDENVAQVSPHSLTPDNRFAEGRLFHKLLNVAPDISSQDLEDTSKLKSITGNSLLNYERKGKDGIPFYYRGRNIFGANLLPNTPDRTDGFMRRPIIVNLVEQFLDDPDPKNPRHHQRDSKLREKVCTLEEQSLLLSYLIHRLIKIRRYGTIRKLPTIEETRQEWDDSTSYIHEWIGEECKLEGKSSSVQLYESYRKYGKIHGKEVKQILSPRRFPDRLEAAVKTVVHKTITLRKQKVKGFEGISLKNAEMVTDVTDISLYGEHKKIDDEMQPVDGDHLAVPSVTDDAENSAFDGYYSLDYWAELSPGILT